MVCENDITDLFWGNSAAKSSSSQLKSRWVVSQKRKYIDGSRSRLHSSKSLKMRRRYDSPCIWKTLIKRQWRHLEVSARLFRYSPRYFVAKLDVCSTEYPAQTLLVKNYEEKVWGEDLYEGVRRLGTGWVEGREQSGSKFDQNRVCGRYRARSGSKLYSRRPVNGWVGESKRLGREWSGSKKVWGQVIVERLKKRIQ